MFRLIVLIVLVVLAVWLIRRALHGASGKTGTQTRAPVQQDLVSCARCGVHLPRSDAHSAAGELYCGEEHARLGARPR